MSKEWAKVRTDIVESKRMCRLLEEHPFAFGLYMIAKARSDDYGRLPADPEKVKARVAPMLKVTVAKVERAIADWVEVGAVERYSVGGEDYLQISEYHVIEETNWQVVGAPDCPHPDGWTAPADLCEHLIEGMTRELKKKDGRPRIYPARYKLTLTMCGAYAEQVFSICRALVEQERSMLSSLVLSCPLLCRMSVDVGGGAGEDRDHDGAPAPERPPSVSPEHDLCGEAHDPVVQAARVYFLSPNPPLLPTTKAQDYGRSCRAQLQGHSDFTDAEIVTAFETNGPRSGSERSFPDRWFERLRRERDGPARAGPQRGQSVTEPASADVFAAAIAQQQAEREAKCPKPLTG